MTAAEGRKTLPARPQQRLNVSGFSGQMQSSTWCRNLIWTILHVHRKVSSGRSLNTLLILLHTSHREERHKYMGTTIEIFKTLEIDMGNWGKCMPVHQSVDVSCLLLLSLLYSITCGGDTVGVKLLGVVFISPMLSVAF